MSEPASEFQVFYPNPISQEGVVICRAKPTGLKLHVHKNVNPMAKKTRTRSDNDKSATWPRVLREQEKRMVRPSTLAQVHGQIPVGATPIGRLHYVWSHFPFDAGIVAQGLRFKPGGMFFCDATVFLAPTSSLIWDAMVDLGTIALVPRIAGEIRRWIEAAPSTNPETHARVHAAFRGDTNCGVTIVPEPRQEWIASAMWYYADLLAVRKLMWHIAEDNLTKQKGTSPTAQEISNHIQQLGTSRAQLLATQGREPNVASHRYNDEWLVAGALCYAIVTGNEVTVVTSDEAVLDQFVKATSLLTRHYEAMHFAHRFVRSPKSFATQTILNPDDELFRESEIVLIKDRFASRTAFLPVDHRPVQMHCVLLQSNVTRATFNADQEMSEVLRVKHVTGGLATNRLSGRNLHFIAPRVVRATYGDVAVIASDKTIAAGGKIPVAFSDLECSLVNDDAIADVKYVDPRILLLPPHCREFIS